MACLCRGGSIMICWFCCLHLMRGCREGRSKGPGLSARLLNDSLTLSGLRNWRNHPVHWCISCQGHLAILACMLYFGCLSRPRQSPTSRLVLSERASHCLMILDVLNHTPINMQNQIMRTMLDKFAGVEDPSAGGAASCWYDKHDKIWSFNFATDVSSIGRRSVSS